MLPKNRTNERRAEMERLTERLDNGQAAVNGCGENCKYDYKYCRNHYEDCPEINRIYESLAEYEDTGLTPERIMELKERDAAKAPTAFEGGKGIIVMDIPKNCGECRFYRQFVGFAQSCVISGRDVDSRCKPSWCPIKQVSNRERGMKAWED